MLPRILFEVSASSLADFCITWVFRGADRGSEVKRCWFTSVRVEDSENRFLYRIIMMYANVEFQLDIRFFFFTKNIFRHFLSECLRFGIFWFQIRDQHRKAPWDAKICQIVCRYYEKFCELEIKLCSFAGKEADLHCGGCKSRSSGSEYAFHLERSQPCFCKSISSSINWYLYVLADDCTANPTDRSAASRSRFLWLFFFLWRVEFRRRGQSLFLCINSSSSYHFPCQAIHPSQRCRVHPVHAAVANSLCQTQLRWFRSQTGDFHLI